MALPYFRRSSNWCVYCCERQSHFIYVSKTNALSPHVPLFPTIDKRLNTKNTLGNVVVRKWYYLHHNLQTNRVIRYVRVTLHTVVLFHTLSHDSPNWISNRRRCAPCQHIWYICAICVDSICSALFLSTQEIRSCLVTRSPMPCAQCTPLDLQLNNHPNRRQTSIRWIAVVLRCSDPKLDVTARQCTGCVQTPINKWNLLSIRYWRTYHNNSWKFADQK